MRKIYFYVIHNTVNEKKYYGVHETDDLEDGYMGSGTAIKRAIKKYGLSCFFKQILHFFDTAEEAYAYEKAIVTEDLIKSGSVYNLTIGGNGGFYHIDSKGVNNPMYGHGDLQKEIQNRPEVKIKKSYAMTINNNFRYANGYVNPIKNTNNYWNNLEKRKNAQIKMSENHVDYNGDKNPFFNKKHTTETLKQLSEKHKNRKRITCPHCNKIGDVSNMARWHMNNCKLRK